MSEKYERLTFWDAYSIAEDIRLAVEENPEKESFEEYFLLSRIVFNRFHVSELSEIGDLVD